MSTPPPISCSIRSRSGHIADRNVHPPSRPRPCRQTCRAWRRVMQCGRIAPAGNGHVIMKITGYKTFLVDAHRMNYIFVKLQTDSGYEGLGESTTEWNEKAVVAALEELGEFLIGKDPFQTDYLIQTMHRNSYWR